jgi:hypothetical protein
MPRSAKIGIAIFAAWALAWCIVGAVGSGEARIGAHLWLAFTGAPMALLSLHLPSASIIAIFFAAMLGTAQWAGVAVVSVWCARRWGG